MCNCSKPVTQSDCDLLKEYNRDPLKRFYIYHISDVEGLMVAMVPNGQNPNDIAAKRGFRNPNGEIEWYSTKEHPCLNE